MFNDDKYGIQLSNFYIIQRNLDVDDESATTKERSEKIILFYPQETPIDDQLTISQLIEGVYDFSKSFSGTNDGADTLYMNGKTHVIKEVEPNTLFIATLSHPDKYILSGGSNNAINSNRKSWKRTSTTSFNSSSSSSSNINKGYTEGSLEECEAGMNDELSRKAHAKIASDILTQLHHRFVLFYGKITSYIFGENGNNNEAIDKLKQLRRDHRKANEAAENLKSGDIEKSEFMVNRAETLDSLKIELDKAEAESPVVLLRDILLEHLLPTVLNINWVDLHLFHSISGFHYLPVDRTTYLSVQHFMNLLETHVPEVEFCALVFNDYLVWSCIPQETMNLLYDYLLSNPIINARKNVVDGGFLTSDDNSIMFPNLYLNGEQGCWSPSHRLLTYQSGLCTLLMLIGLPSLNMNSQAKQYKETASSDIDEITVEMNNVDINDKIDISSSSDNSSSASSSGGDHFGVTVIESIQKVAKTIKVSCASDLSRLNIVLHDQYSRIISTTSELESSSSKFLYFNQMNNAIKVVGMCSSLDITLGNITKGASAIPPPTKDMMCKELDSNLAYILNNIHTRLNSVQSNSDEDEHSHKEMYLYAGPSVGWVRGCKSFDRELLIAINTKGLGLSEISEESEKIQDKFFGGIFL